MDKEEILSYVERFVKKRGYKTMPYMTFMTMDMPQADFAVYKDDMRLGTVTFRDNKIELEAWSRPTRQHYYFNPHDPNSLPNLVEQIKATFIALRGIDG